MDDDDGGGRCDGVALAGSDVGDDGVVWGR